MAGLIKRGKTWYAVIRENGKERRVSLKTSSVARAREKLVDMERESRSGEAARLDMPVEDFTELLIKHINATRSPHTVKTLLHEWKHFRLWAKPLRLSDCTHKVLLDYRNHLIEEDYAPSTVRTTIAELASIFKVAIEERGVFSGPNPAHSIPLVKEIEEIPRYLSKEEIPKVVSAAEAWGPDLHLAVGLGIFAGLRLNEIVHAVWEWAILNSEENGHLVVQPTAWFTPKGKRPRTVPLHPALRSILLRYRPERSSGWIIRPEVNPKPNATTYRVDFRAAFDTVLKNSGIADPESVTPHTLRHTFASQLAIKGESIYKISGYMGHKSIQTTMIYAHLAPQTDRIDF